MNFIKTLSNNLNSTQRLIVATLVPLVLFIVTYVIAEEVDGFSSNAFNMDDTWLVWVIFLGRVSYFEFNLFSTKNS